VTVVLVPRPAAADQIASLKTQATTVSEKLIQEQLQIGADQQQYSLATEKVSADARAIAQIGRQITRDETRIKTKANDVRHQAIVAYMDSDTGSSGSAALLFTGDAEQTSLANEYTAVAAGNIETSIDQLRTAQSALHAHELSLEQEQIQDQADQRAQATDLSEAEGTEHQMETVQSTVTGQLAAAIASQSASRAAAAAAAVAAAQRAAAQKAAGKTTAAGPGKVAGTATPAGSDPALNPFLQCVVQAESGGNYGEVSPNGLYMGAFQFSQPTWNTAAADAGLPGLVGTPPNLASKADQDTVAVALYSLDGRQPWLGDRCSS
jgi:Transglycosylase-like domain